MTTIVSSSAARIQRVVLRAALGSATVAGVTLPTRRLEEALYTWAAVEPTARGTEERILALETMTTLAPPEKRWGALLDVAVMVDPRLAQLVKAEGA